MYVNITGEKRTKLECEFRGLIATSKYYKKYNNKTKSYNLITFITIGYSNQVYIDLVVKGWIKTKHKNICSGKGLIKITKDYASNNVDFIDYK